MTAPLHTTQRFGIVATPAPADILRLLEAGDRMDLAWLFGQLGEPELARFFERYAERLSRRSRAFWAVVLDRAEPTARPLAGELWPLAG